MPVKTIMKFAAVMAVVLSPVSGLAEDGHKKHGHKHGTKLVEMPAGQPAPTVRISVSKDPIAGWNLHVMTGNFRFAPEHASGAHVLGEGHAHLYIDGKKTSRLYGPWFHFGGLTAGKHEIKVSLNANNHADYAVAGKPIAAVTEIGVAAAASVCPKGHKCFSLQIAGTSLARGEKTIRIKKGDKVALAWSADHPCQVHLHGYDLKVDVPHQGTRTTMFVAHATGRFPVTLHGDNGKHSTLLHVEVHPN